MTCIRVSLLSADCGSWYTRKHSAARLEVAVLDCVHYYNPKRIKLRPQGLSPVEDRLRRTA
ncbi:MAG: IS3 family transposase [Pseudorhizobium sp.]